MSPHIRLGMGQIIDRHHKVPGQLDIVVELPFGPSLQIEEGSSRLYFADLVASVISVKSDLARQFDGCIEELKKVRALDCDLNAGSKGRFLKIEQKIPFFAVGYIGFETAQSLKEKILKFEPFDRPNGVLCIKSGAYDSMREEREIMRDGWRGLLAFVDDINDDACSMMLVPDLYSYMLD